jgi:chemotaxis protein MotB
MMTMFVMFAVMLAYFLSERNVLDAFQSELESKTGTGGQMGEEAGKQGGGGSGTDPALSDEETSEEETPEDSGLSPEKLLELTESAMSETNIEDVEVYLQDDKTVKISLRGPLLFDLGSANLREETKRFLGKVSFVLSKTKNEVHVVGHTDTAPIHSTLFETNWELSVSRAAAVARHLIKAANLEAGRFTVMGNSMYRPVAPNTTLENKQLNRRVEIIITKKIYQEPIL